ncbi:mechanosensitive ion channel family protein [Halomonas sp. HP20-15]|uniref:mechanosensitive ion channel family protein n=1 Tax=Halomonas sp. HP20-15 TaxID=3085901 RepID=UPI002982ADB9|nr:mechanosensitive ion channel family protein [Halomonas sp. HP20-15]MDW5378291.1 mechanosensitive ion channel family protein [Halomonas sp. HP20-15]
MPGRALLKRLGGMIVVCLGLAFSAAAAGQGLSLGALTGGGGTAEGDKAQADPERLRESLDSVIATLENDARRADLLSQLKTLRESTGALKAGEEGDSPQGLLGALADSFTDLGEQAGTGHSPLDVWAQRAQRAADDTAELVESMGRIELMRQSAEAAVLLAVWFGLLSLLMGAGRLLARRRDWPLTLPPEPRAWLLVVHFLRKVVPWILAFVVMLASLRWLSAPTPARATVLVIAYVALCGRILSTVFDVVISVFTRGHRRVAVAILRQQAPRRLFVIGALAAFGDAVNSERLTTMLGGDLASWLSVLANVLAGVMSGALVIRLRRPVKHLIRNRPYAERRDQSSLRDLAIMLGNYWHIPALLLIGVSLAAIFVSAGEADGAFTRAILCAALLVLTLVTSGGLRRHAERVGAIKRTSQYRRRLKRFFSTLAQFLCWVLFAELSLRIWGFSLLGIGDEGAISARIGQALLRIGVTVLLAWLVWIFADTAIQRALRSASGTRGRRINSTRAQTITPMVRNVVFFTILVIASIVGLANLGVNVTPLLAGAGVIGLAIGFGAQTLVQDLITGLFILIEDSLSIDDFVDVGGHMGTVEGLSLRTVRLRDLDGIVHIIPFSQIKGIQNFAREFGIALLRIRIPHNMPIDDAIALVREVADALRQDPMMRHHIWSALELQGVESFDQGAAILRVRMRTSPLMQWDVARAFNLRLKQRMDGEGIDLSLPRLSVMFENPPYGGAGEGGAVHGPSAAAARTMTTPGETSRAQESAQEGEAPQ